MDANIRSLLKNASSTGKGQTVADYLNEAYLLLKNYAETQPTLDAPESFSADLYVLCAETAFQKGKKEIAKDCLKMYFMKNQPANQFLCRAYLCQAQLLAPDTANDPDQLESAVVYLIKAISFAKENPRYHFLVYNASVLYWQFCRPFLKTGYRQYLSTSLHHVVKALDDIDDRDYEWRAQLVIALIECHMDAGRHTEAAAIAAVAHSLIRQHVPDYYKQLFGLMARYNLIDPQKFTKEIKANPDLAIYYKICKLKQSIETKDPDLKDIPGDLNRILYHIVNGEEMKLTVPESKKRNPAAPFPKEKSDVESKRKTKKTSEIIPPTAAKLDKNNRERPKLLLELSRLCLDQELPDLAKKSVEAIKDCVTMEQGFYIEVEFLQSQIMVKSLSDKQESYQKVVVDIRLAAIKRCEEALINAVRSGNPNVIQAGCVTQWNLCLPLLQPNLRRHVRKPLTLVSEALRDIESLLILLRCQVHTELAKCEEDEEQIQVAMEHLRQALALDDGGVYRDRLETSFKRLQLRAELYKQPERPEDQAAMIIEQARKSDSGTIRMKRSLLVRAGQALSPDAFLLVLDSENDTKDLAAGAAGKGVLTVFKKLAGKARQFDKCVSKAEGHLKRLGDENDQERAALWADLTKVARKQEVWDVCRVAARFALLYDDNRWTNPQPPVPESPRKKKLPPPPPQPQVADSPDVSPTNVEGQEDSSSPKNQMTSRQATNISRSDSPTPFHTATLYEKDLMRMLSEVNFIQGEALIHLLRCEGIQLGDSPIPPEDKSKRPKGYVAKKPSEDPDWICYCDWIKNLSSLATRSFLRGSELGIELREPWIVCCAASYIWNYNNHILTQNRHPEIVDTLSTILDALKKVGHARETSLFVNISTALAYGLIKPWLPRKAVKPSEAVVKLIAGDKSPPRSPKSKKPSQQKLKSATPVAISQDAQPDLKRALECLVHAIDVTNGDNAVDVVPIAIRHPLLQMWVLNKQMLQQQIGKTLGTTDTDSKDGQKPMTRALTAVEMLQLNSNGILEFKDGPGLAEVISMVEGCTWTDKLIEVQIWTRLTYLAYSMKEHASVIKTSGKALDFAETGTQLKNRKLDSHKHKVEQEMFSYSSCLLGQSYMENMSGKNAIRRLAMTAFFDSVRFGAEAENYQLVINAARHYWNACIPLVSLPIERELLKEPLRVILECIAETDIYQQKQTTAKPPLPPSSRSGTPVGGLVSGSTDTIVSQSKLDARRDEDLTLRAAMYGVLFQSYADKRGEWEKGIEAMDEAVNCMPRTSHRLLIFKHRVLVKAKLGRSVLMDIQKFKDESEDYLSHMWRRVALSSKEKPSQLLAYQNAIESLSEVTNDWQKFDYLIEFSQWLYCNEFPLVEATDMLQWAIDILMNMETKEDEISELQESSTDVGKGKKAKKGKKDESLVSKSSHSNLSKKSSAEDATKGDTSRTSISDAGSGEVNVADFIPVEKQAVIGVLPRNTELTVDDLTDVQQLEGLFRAHVLLAQISGRDSQQFSDYLLMAYSFIMKIWQVCLTSAGPVMKELAKNPPASADTNGNKSAKKGGGGKKEKEKEPAKEKPKRKGPLDAVPASTDDWAVYDTPDEVLEAFKQDAMKTRGVNTSTLTKPTLTYFYLELLTEYLRDFGYNHLALPVLAFSEMMSRDLIKCRPLTAYLHFKAAQVCIELNMNHGINFHLKLAGPLHLNDEEQAQSREQMVLWKEKLVQVAKEEMRVKESLLKMNAEIKSPSKKTPSTRMASKPVQTPGEDMDPSSVHMGKKLGNIEMREVWTDTAELLISQGSYQPARQILDESYKAALAFNDKPLIARILYNLAVLSFHEAQYGQAVSLSKEAQEADEGDEIFWYRTEELIVDSLLHNYALKDRIKQARNHLDYALTVFLEIAADRPNKQAITGYILAMLEAKFAQVQNKMARERYENDLIRLGKAKQSMLAACQKLENCTEKLFTLGYRREPVKLMKQYADILHYLAKESADPEEQHGFYLQALRVLSEADVIADEVYQHVLTITPVLAEMTNISLPVQRELADIKLGMAVLMIDMFEVFAKEEREKFMEEQRKNSVVKMVEELISKTPDRSHIDKQWIDTMPSIADKALSLLANVHSLASSIPKLKAQCLYNIGRCLRLVSWHANPNGASVWDINSLELSNLEGMVEEAEKGEHAEEDEQEMDENNKIFIRNTKLIKNLKESLKSSHHYLSQATECLFQAVNISLNSGYTEICGSAALEIVECCGQYDPTLTAAMLALHQSCQSSIKLQELLHKAQQNPTSSQQAALLAQRECLLENDITTNYSASPLFSCIQATLQKQSEAWKRLSILPNHFELLKEFPPNFNVIILQHSPDRSYLYGAVVEKPKASGKEAGKGKHASIQVPPKTKVVRIKTSRDEVEDYLAQLRQHKSNVQQLMLKQEYKRSQQALRQKMLANLEKHGNISPQPTILQFDEEEEKLQIEFNNLVNDLDCLLKPLLAQVESVYRPVTTTSMSNATNQLKDAVPAGETVILLADPWLLEMPLEALPSLQYDTINALCRDFSLQFLYHRYHFELEDPAEKKAKEKTKPPSRIAGLRDAGMKKAKIIPLDRQVPATCVAVDTTHFRYFVDPHLDCAETETHAPIEIFEQVLEKHSQQFTARWLGILGSEHAPSAGEYEIYLTESSAVLYYGMERFLSEILPEKVASLNLPECMIVGLYDLAQTSKSFLRQSKIDIFKNAEQMLLERPLDTAMLLSLTGIRCLFTNQWHCTLEDNARKMDETAQDLLAGGLTTGQAIRLQFTPYRRKVEEAEATVEEEQEKEKSKAEEKPAGELEEECPEEKLNRTCFNMVCYGLPNIMVTLLTN